MDKMILKRLDSEKGTPNHEKILKGIDFK